MAAIPDTCRTFSELLQYGYATYGTRTAATDARGRITYADLGDRACRIAAELRRRGVRPGDRVALIIGNRTEYLQLEQAIVLGGYVRVCAITRLHSSEVTHILADAKPAYAFIEARWLESAEDEFLSRLSYPVVIVGANEDADIVKKTRAERFDDFLAQAQSPTEPHEVGADDLAWFMYTSGSTGVPKGVMHTNATLLAMVRMTVGVMGTVRSDDIALHTAPLSHFSGAIAHAIQACGGENVLLDGFQSDELFDAAERHGATVLPVVPTQLNMLTERLREWPRDLARIRVVPYAGSAIAPDRLAAAKSFFGDVLVQCYGASEVPMPVTALHPGEHVDVANELGLARFASAGRPVNGVELAIRDDRNQPAPPGSPGEIVVRSPTGTIGYWRNTEATAEILEADGFIHTGDIGVIDREGYLFIVDRKKDMIVTGGFNVFPREVENVIAAMPEVLEVAVVSAPDDKWGEAIVAVVVQRTGLALTLDRIQAHCREKLAGYKVPKRLLLLEDLPKTSTGKLHKLALKERFWSARERKIGG